MARCTNTLDEDHKCPFLSVTYKLSVAALVNYVDALLIVASHAFTRHRAHEISYFYVTFSCTVLVGNLAMTISRHP